MGKTNIRIEQVGKGGLSPLAFPKFQAEQKLSGQRGQAKLPDLFYFQFDLVIGLFLYKQENSSVAFRMSD